MKIRLKKLLRLCSYPESITLFDHSNYKYLLKNQMYFKIPKKYLNWYVLEISGIKDCHLTFAIIEPKKYKEHEHLVISCPYCSSFIKYKNWFDWVLHTPIHWFSKRRVKCGKCGNVFYSSKPKFLYDKPWSRYWDYQNDGTHFCSECGADAPYNYEGKENCSNYCPKCGSYMMEVRNKDE